MSELQARVQEALSPTYTLERELGGGGMSRVFLALEHRLGRQVVIKLLSPDLAAAMSTTRFEREIKVAASLQQANIVPVLAAGEAAGLPYYTMPFVEGESLRARLGRGPVSIAEVVSILRDVSRALDYAHERGVMHRDIKPDNVLLSGHTAVVTDFGIAKAIAAAAERPAGATITQLGTAVGTPNYMAPEQAAGDPGTDHRADIYAFGCMAYEMLGGRAPFAGRPTHRLLYAHMSETPQPVSELRGDCPPALATLIMQCLAKEPDARPGRAADVMHQLEGVVTTSGTSAALPAMLLGGRSMLWRAVGVYAVAFVVVAVLARAAIAMIGLPDWVFSGALIVMALGLPLILFTGYSQYAARRVAMTTPTYTPGGNPARPSGQGTMEALAIKASPHVSWKRAARGGALAVGAFVLVVAGYMATRALGIGPAGSLIASGQLSTNDLVVVAAFDAGADLSLGATIAEAVKTNLSQSDAVHVMTTSRVVATLQQMQRPDTARVDYATAREIAQRTGAKAVVTGTIVPAGVGYIVTARLVEATSGDNLAMYTESARDAGALIDAVDRVTKSLRRKMGESLKTVRNAPRLEQVTTASLGALQSYAAGLRSNDVQGDYPSAVQHFRDAIRQDSSFAMAWVQLSYSLTSQGGSGSSSAAADALTRGFQLRERLPERERYNVEGAYYWLVEADRRRALPALRRAVELDSTNVDAVNNLAIVLSDTRNYAEAERAARLAVALDPGNGTLVANLATLYTRMGRREAFDSTMAKFDRDSIPFPTGPTRFGELMARFDHDAAERHARAGADTANPRGRVAAQEAVMNLLVLRGKLREAERMHPVIVDGRARFRADTVSPYRTAYFNAMVDGRLRGNGAKALARLDSTVRAHPPGSATAGNDAVLSLALGYSQLGEPGKARQLTDAYAARLDSIELRRIAVFLNRARGVIALADGKVDSALVYARRGDFEADGLPTSNGTVFTPFALGVAFDRAGQQDSARTYLTEFVEMAGTGRYQADPFHLAPTLFRLGQLYQNAGDRTRALEYYSRFVDLWRNADPELQPKVTEARKAIGELIPDQPKR